MDVKQAIIVASMNGDGAGWRHCRPLESIAGTPFLIAQLRLLASLGIDRVLLVGDGPPNASAFEPAGRLPAVTTCAVPNGASMLDLLMEILDFLDEEFLVLDSQTYFQFDLKLFQELHRESGAAATIHASRPEIGYWLIERDLLHSVCEPGMANRVWLSRLTDSHRLHHAPNALRWWSRSTAAGRHELEQFLTPKLVVVLDRDGVINERPGLGQYVTRWGEFALRPAAMDGLAGLAARGIRFVVATNQAGVAKGLLTSDTALMINDRMVADLTGRGLNLLSIEMCQHADSDRCPCRKPAPGMLLRLACKWHLPLVDTYFVGDDVRDMQTAIRAGCNGAFLGDADVAAERGILRERGLELVTAPNEAQFWTEVAERVTQAHTCGRRLGRTAEPPEPVNDVLGERDAAGPCW